MDFLNKFILEGWVQKGELFDTGFCLLVKDNEVMLIHRYFNYVKIPAFKVPLVQKTSISIDESDNSKKSCLVTESEVDGTGYQK